MRLDIIYPLTGKRRSCYIEASAIHRSKVYGFWTDDGELLDDNDLCMIAETYRDDIRRLLAESRAEEEMERRQEMRRDCD